MTEAMTYTRWFFAEHDKPKRVGVYEISALGINEWLRWFAYWNGERFTEVCSSPEYAENALNGSVFGLFFWRGLSQDPALDRDAARLWIRLAG